MKNFINRALVAKKKLKLFFALFAMLALHVNLVAKKGAFFQHLFCVCRYACMQVLFEIMI